MVSDDLEQLDARRRPPLLDGSPGDWDSDMQCYPHVFECDGRSTCSTTATSSAPWLRPGGAGAMSWPSNPLEQGSEAEIAEHLRRCDAGFVPPLSEPGRDRRLCTKIGDPGRAVRGWAAGTLVGLVAAYCNDAGRGSPLSPTSASLPDIGRGKGSHAAAASGASNMRRRRLRRASRSRSIAAIPPRSICTRRRIQRSAQVTRAPMAMQPETGEGQT